MTKASHGTESDVRLRRRSDANKTIWFIALTKEQLALIMRDRLHGISFQFELSCRLLLLLLLDDLGPALSARTVDQEEENNVKDGMYKWKIVVHGTPRLTVRKRLSGSRKCPA